MGVAYAQEPPITTAIRTALGSAPIPVAIERLIGTSSAVVAVLDMKFVSTVEIRNTVANSYDTGKYQYNGTDTPRDIQLDSNLLLKNHCKNCQGKDN